MPLYHAIVWADHQRAEVLQFDAEHVEAQHLRAHTHHTAQHGSAVRTQHEFYAELCAALEGITEILVTGSHTSLADLKHYVEKHRPKLMPCIVGYETVDHPTTPQLVALGRKFFRAYDQMAGQPRG